MEQFKQIIRWPANEVNCLAPWYQVAWRALWFIPAAAVLFVYCLLIGVMYGYTSAEETWRDNV